MRRLARHFFTLCAVVSLLLCVAVCVLWVRSYWNSETGLSGLRPYRLLSSRGTFHLQPNPLPPDGGGVLFWRFLGFRYGRIYNGLSSRWALQFPHWFPVLLTGILPVVWVAKWTRQRVRVRRIQRRGLCPSCGYDLRASPERCPECGADK